MITNKILVTFILLITIFLNSCASVYKKEKITFQNPPKYEYRCSGEFRYKCKKVNTNIKVEKILKDRYKSRYKDLSEEEIEQAIDVYETNAGFIALGIEVVAWVGGTIYITITSSGSSGALETYGFTSLNVASAALSGAGAYVGASTACATSLCTGLYFSEGIKYEQSSLFTNDWGKLSVGSNIQAGGNININADNYSKTGGVIFSEDDINFNVKKDLNLKAGTNSYGGLSLSKDWSVEATINSSSGVGLNAGYNQSKDKYNGTSYNNLQIISGGKFTNKGAEEIKEAIWDYTAYVDLVNNDLNLTDEQKTVKIQQVAFETEEKINEIITNISEELIEFIKIEEGIVKDSKTGKIIIYKDGGGYDTIGYGHLITDEEKANPKIMAKYKAGITEEEAMALFKQDITYGSEDGRIRLQLVKNINAKINNSMAQQQFDAVFSAIYNSGGGNFINSNLWKVIKKDPTNYNDIGEAWEKYALTSKRKIQNGLITRRKREFLIYSQGIYINEYTGKPIVISKNK